jgi:putative transposase
MSSRGVKFIAHPTPEQRQQLSRYFGASRVVWNAKCDENEYFRRFKRTSPALVGESLPVDQCYAHFKSDLTPWLDEVPSQILRNTASRWYTSYQRFWDGTAGRPRRKKKGNHDSILLTNEIFELRTIEHPKTGRMIHQVFVGAKTKNAGWLEFEPHREYEAPNSVTVSRTNGKYYVSFAYDGGPQATEEELIEQYSQLDAASLSEQTVGIDRGVVIPVCTSKPERFDFTPQEKRSLARADRRRKRAQRKLSRQVNGSNRRRRTKHRIGHQSAKAKAIRHDRAHKISRALAKSEATVVAVEDLKIKQMTKRPKPVIDPERSIPDQPVYQPNQATAKAGLNRKRLASAWGLVVTLLSYKALRLGKLVVNVSAYESSQECLACGHTTPANRVTQSKFVCQNPNCGHMAHADENAAGIIRKRGVQEVYRLAEAQRASGWRVTSGTGERSPGTKSRRKKARGAVRQSGIVIPDDREKPGLEPPTSEGSAKLGPFRAE